MSDMTDSKVQAAGTMMAAAAVRADCPRSYRARQRVVDQGVT